MEEGRHEEDMVRKEEACLGGRREVRRHEEDMTRMERGNKGNNRRR